MFEKIRIALWGVAILLLVISGVSTFRIARRSRRRATGWMDPAEQREWERKRTQDTEYLRQSKGS